MAASDGTLRVQDKSKVRSFSRFDEILAGHSSCPIFCKVAELQKAMDFRGERIEQLQSDVEKKDEDILTLKASLRCREADSDHAQPREARCTQRQAPGSHCVLPRTTTRSCPQGFALRP